jgi:ribosomal protein S18 acetylase RimI-like enzyme
MRPTNFRQIFRDSNYGVRLCAGEADIEALYALEFAEFGEDACSHQRILQLWHSYPDCFFVLTDGNQVIGSLRIWPVADEIADDFQAGRIGNAGLACRLTTAQLRQTPHARWSINSLAIHPNYRLGGKSAPIPLLLAYALNEWADSGLVAYPVEIMTTANSTAGQNLMTRFGFIQERAAEQMVDGRALYIKRAPDKNALFAVFAERGIGSLSEMLHP